MKIAAYILVLVGTCLSQQIMIGNTTDSVFVKQVQENSKANAYKLARDDIYEAENYLDDVSRYELHVGTGVMDYKEFNKMGFVALKVNLGRGKITNIGVIDPLLERAKYSAKEYEFKSNSELLAKIDNLKNRIEAYNNRPWYTRIGVGVMVPLIIEKKTRESSTQWSTTENKAKETIDTSVVTTTHNYKDIEDLSSDFNYMYSKTSFVIMYDVSSYFTMESGINYDREFTFGISIDISTPITRLGHSFFKMFGGKAGMTVQDNPKLRSNSDYYYY